MGKEDLQKRLANGGTLVVAEGYLFEFERRGYLKAGTYVPEVVIEHPELVKQLHEEFVHAGSEVCLAFTYYAHREKMALIGREVELEKINRTALKIAREVADATGTLMAGNICNSTVYKADDPSTHAIVAGMFKEQVEWCVEEGADFIVAESYTDYGEAKLALDAIKEYGNGLPAVVTFWAAMTDETGDGIHLAEACKKIEDGGAAVVGLNCSRGPATMLPLLKEIKAACKGPVAALPVPYRTTKEEPTFFCVRAPGADVRAFPVDLPACLCGRSEIQHFAEACKEMGIQYVGICCGNSSHYLRIVADVYGKNPPAKRYAPEMSKHYIFGDKAKFTNYYTDKIKSHIAGTAD